MRSSISRTSGKIENILKYAWGFVFTSFTDYNDWKVVDIHTLSILNPPSPPTEKIIKVADFIRATAQHLSVAATDDLAFFLDFDLAILGAAPEVYTNYAAAVREEYQHVPGFLYRRGRKKVLRYFLEAPRLYRTEALYDLLEEKARENLRLELSLLK